MGAENTTIAERQAKLDQLKVTAEALYFNGLAFHPVKEGQGILKPETPIRDILASSGWSRADIDSVFTEQGLIQPYEGERANLDTITARQLLLLLKERFTKVYEVNDPIFSYFL